MLVHIVKLIAKPLAWVPLPVNHRIGATIGWLVWASHSKLRTISLINLSLCFPDWSEQEKQRVAKASLIECGKALSESFWLWDSNSDDVLKKLHIVEGENLLRAAQQSEQGLIVASPHIGAWETCCLPLVTDELTTCLYKPPRYEAIEPLIITGRKNVGGVSVRLAPTGIKHVLKKLKNGKTIGILPDQEPDEANGVFANLFAQSANTMTLLAKFAYKTNANVLFCYSRRLPKGAGWQVHYFSCDDDIKSQDKNIAAQALNQAIEQCILLCPEQYLWSYKRFRICTDGSRRNYRATA